MKVLIKKQKGRLNNSCIRWYLSEEKLWITTFKEFAGFETAIIDLYGEIYNLKLEERKRDMIAANKDNKITDIKIKMWQQEIDYYAGIFQEEVIL